jgi:hypothetical protein
MSGSTTLNGFGLSRHRVRFAGAQSARECTAIDPTGGHRALITSNNRSDVYNGHYDTAAALNRVRCERRRDDLDACELHTAGTCTRVSRERRAAQVTHDSRLDDANNRSSRAFRSSAAV